MNTIYFSYLKKISVLYGIYSSLFIVLLCQVKLFSAGCLVKEQSDQSLITDILWLIMLILIISYFYIN